MASTIGEVKSVLCHALVAAKKFEDAEFNTACILIVSLYPDSPHEEAFMKHWKETGLDFDAVDFKKLAEQKKAVELLLKIVDFNDWQEKLWNKYETKETYMKYLEAYCAMTNAPPAKAMWVQRTPAPVIERILKNTYASVKTDNIQGFIAGGFLLRLMTGNPIKEGDIDFFVTDISEGENDCSELFRAPNDDDRDDWYLFGGCVSHVSMRHQYIGLPAGTTPENKVLAFDGTHLEMFYDGDKLMMSDMCMLSLRTKTSYCRRPYVSGLRFRKADKMGFHYAPDTIVLDGVKLCIVAPNGKWKDVNGRAINPKPGFYPRHLDYVQITGVIREVLLHADGYADYDNSNFTFTREELLGAKKLDKHYLSFSDGEIRLKSKPHHHDDDSESVEFAGGMCSNIGWTTLMSILTSGGSVKADIIMHENKILAVQVEKVAAFVPLADFAKTLCTDPRV